MKVFNEVWNRVLYETEITPFSVKVYQTIRSKIQQDDSQLKIPAKNLHIFEIFFSYFHLSSWMYLIVPADIEFFYRKFSFLRTSKSYYFVGNTKTCSLSHITYSRWNRLVISWKIVLQKDDANDSNTDTSTAINEKVFQCCWNTCEADMNVADFCRLF